MSITVGSALRGCGYGDDGKERYAWRGRDTGCDKARKTPAKVVDDFGEKGSAITCWPLRAAYGNGRFQSACQLNKGDCRIS